MKEKIVYDFNLSKKVSNNLEEVVQNLNTEIIVTENDNLKLLAEAWNSKGAELYVKRSFISEVKNIRNEILKEIEQINLVSRKMYLIEQETKKTATEKRK